MSGESFSHFSYHVGDGWQVTCNIYADTTPILTVSGGPSTLAISTRGRDANVNAVEFARALAREARRFLDEMERMRGTQFADADRTGKAASDSAA
jgi:hypothetical protein